MRLTAFTDYSLRLLIYVASSPEGRATIAEVAGAFGISESHLVKVAHHLGRAGFLANVRGRGSGLALARAPEAINLAKVVKSTEGGDLPAECFDRAGNTCPIAGHCELQRALGQALNAFYAVLERYTLADLTANRRELARLLR